MSSRTPGRYLCLASVDASQTSWDTHCTGEAVRAHDRQGALQRHLRLFCGIGSRLLLCSSHARCKKWYCRSVWHRPSLQPPSSRDPSRVTACLFLAGISWKEKIADLRLKMAERSIVWFVVTALDEIACEFSGFSAWELPDLVPGPLGICVLSEW